MAVDLEISPAEALKTLEEQSERLSAFGKRLLIGDANLEDEKPVALFLKSRGIYYRDDGTAEDARYQPRLNLSYFTAESSYREPRVHHTGQFMDGSPGWTTTRGYTTVPIPERHYAERYVVRVNRVASIGLIAVSLQMEQSPGKAYNHPIPIRDEQTQQMLCP